MPKAKYQNRRAAPQKQLVSPEVPRKQLAYSSASRVILLLLLIGAINLLYGIQLPRNYAPLPKDNGMPAISGHYILPDGKFESKASPSTASSTPQNRKVGLLTFCHDNHCSGYFDGAMCLMASYAAQHNYTLILPDKSICMDSGRDMKWCKVLALQRYLADFDWVVWMDIDTILVNHTFTLEERFEFEDAEKGEFDVYIGADNAGMNTGMVAIRNTPWSHTFLDRWWKSGEGQDWALIGAQTDGLKCWQDQWGLMELLRNQSSGLAPEFPQNGSIKILERENQRRFNAYSSEYGNIESRYHVGDFLVHLAGCRDDSNRNCVKEFNFYANVADLSNSSGNHTTGGSRKIVRTFIPEENRNIFPCLSACNALTCEVSPLTGR